MSNEIWKPINGYDGLYEISNLGSIKSLERKVNSRYGTHHTIKEQVINCAISKDGYCTVMLYKNGKSERKRIHRLVYEAFICSIPKGYDIHHINNNKQDNRLENLELIEHILHIKNHKNEKDCIKAVVERCSKPVIQYLNDELIAEYSSAVEAERQTGIDNAHISACCNNKPKHKTAGGYIWKFKSC